MFWLPMQLIKKYAIYKYLLNKTENEVFCVGEDKELERLNIWPKTLSLEGGRT